MKAIVLDTYGSPDVLKLRDIDKPVPADNEVLVRVHAASVNSWDWELLRGVSGNRLIFGLRRPRIKVLGADMAGRVEAVGRSAKRFQPGDEVFGDISACGWGGFAEYVSVPEDPLALKPDGMTFEEAAAVPQAAVLALQGLRKGRLKEGQSVLINGAGGGVGTFAIQIAKSFGTEVTGVDAAEKLDTMRSAGADHVIDYAQEDFTRNAHRYDLILDSVARRSVFDYTRALAPSGTCVIVGGSSARILQAVLLGWLIQHIRKKRITLLMHRPKAEDLDTLNDLFEKGKIRSIIDKTYPLSEVPDAIRHVEEGHARGKVVITV